LDFIVILAARQLESPPWAIMMPLAQAFGFIINLLFNLAYSISPAGSLGVAIVLMTLIFRLLIMPLGLKSQKAMMKMRELKPELDKIKEKYGNSKDPEIMRKSQKEQTALMAKHGANPLTGCLPMLIQMPLFFGLNIVMRQASVHVASLRGFYYDLAYRLLQIPGLVSTYYQPTGPLERLAFETVEYREPIVPAEMIQGDYIRRIGEWLQAEGLWGYDLPLDQVIANLRAGVAHFSADVFMIGLPEDLGRVLSRFTADDWAYLYNYIPAEYLPEIQGMVNHITGVERFMGISMVESIELWSIGMVLPILTGISMFISSWLMQQRTYDPNANEQAVMMQRMMLFVMPIMMAVFTVNLVAAVGVFWVTGQIFQIIQDLILLKKSGTPIRLPFSKASPEVVDVVPAKKKKK